MLYMLYMLYIYYICYIARKHQGVQQAARTSSDNTLLGLQRAGVGLKSHLHFAPAEGEAGQAMKTLEIAFSTIRHRNQIAKIFDVRRELVQTERICVAASIEDTFQTITVQLPLDHAEGLAAFGEGLAFDETKHKMLFNINKL